MATTLQVKIAALAREVSAPYGDVIELLICRMSIIQH